MAKENKEKEIIKEEAEEKVKETAENIKEEVTEEKAPETSESEPAEETAEEKEAVIEEDLKDEEGKDSGDGKKKLFGKGKDKEKDKLKDQIAELNDKVVRQMAEFDNFRKRTEKEKQQMFETGAKSVIENACKNSIERQYRVGRISYACRRYEIRNYISFVIAAFSNVSVLPKVH